MVRLKHERLKRGWSLQALGFYAGMQGAEISKIERGIVRPYPSQKEKLARMLGLEPEELLEEVGGAELPTRSKRKPAAARA
jgi:transcriptional regulator with XRE-family HTH domain